MAIIKKLFRIKKFKQKTPLVSFKNISFSYGKKRILDDVGFDLFAGELVGLLGPNGAGKSTIMSIISGLINPDRGKIFFGKDDGTDYPIYLRTRKYNISLVPQAMGFFHDLSVEKNLLAISELVIENPNERVNKVNELINKFSLDHVREVKCRHCSGGEKRKVALCMALLRDPHILLLDEPMIGLDVLSVQMLKEILLTMQKERPQMLILITEHAAAELLQIVDRALILNNTKIIAQGTPRQLSVSKPAEQYFGSDFKFY